MQRPFAFYLSALTLIAVLCFGCGVNPNLQGKGEVYLQGEWQQDSIPMQNKLLEYSTYRLKFSCDSFYLQISSFSKVNNRLDTCVKSGRWVEYVKGDYRQQGDTLHLKGQFCNAHYEIKEEGGCFRAGPYEELFKVSKKTDSLIQFSSTSSVIPINAHLIKHTTCNPKSL